MNFQTKASVVSLILIIAGVGVLIYTLTSVINTSSELSGSLSVFVGLGLLMTGILLLFASPEVSVRATVLTNTVWPPVSNLALMLKDRKSKGGALHMPSQVLGSPTQVFLIIGSNAEVESFVSMNLLRLPELSWRRDFGVLKPTGIGLMDVYERALRRDFFGLETETLSRSLERAIISELQLASDFSLTVRSERTIEALWRRTTIPHQCLDNEVTPTPELCSLCSSVACALAKATGRPVAIESSTSPDEGITVVTTYTIWEVNT